MRAGPARPVRSTRSRTPAAAARALAGPRWAVRGGCGEGVASRLAHRLAVDVVAVDVVAVDVVAVDVVAVDVVHVDVVPVEVEPDLLAPAVEGTDSRGSGWPAHRRGRGWCHRHGQRDLVPGRAVDGVRREGQRSCPEA